MNLQTLALFSMVVIAVGGVAWVFLYPLLSGERQAEKRRESVARAEPIARDRSGVRSRRNRGASRSRKRSRKSMSGRGGPRNLPLSIKITQAGLILVEASVPADRSRPRAVDVRAAVSLPGRHRSGVGRGLRRGLRRSAVAAVLSEEAPRKAVSRRLSGCGRRDCARHQVRPAAARQPEDHHRPKRPSRSRANSARSWRHRPSACRSARPAPSFTSACRCPEANFFGIVISIQQKAGGNLVRSARQPVARVARPQEDEGQDPGHVDGSQGLGGDHRFAADRRRRRSSISRARITSSCFGPRTSAES